MGPFLALDSAGNLISKFQYSKTGRFGWVAADSDKPGVTYPLHWQAQLRREQDKTATAIIPPWDPQLRLSLWPGRIYRVLYLTAVGALIVFMWTQYVIFKHWLNPPARQGLINIEGWLWYYPRIARDTSCELPVVKECAVPACSVVTQFKQMALSAVGFDPERARRAEAERRAREEAERMAKRREAAAWKRRSLIAGLVAITALALL